MEIQPIKTTEYKEKQAQNRKEALAAGVMGALAGYSVKYAVPVSQYERDTFITEGVSRGIRNQIEGARADEIKVIREEIMAAPEKFLKGVDEFLVKNKRAIILGQKELVDGAIDSLDGNTKVQTKEVLNRISGFGSEATRVAEKSARAVIKEFRPALMFMAVGTAVALSIVTLKNSLTKFQDSYIEEKKKLAKLA